MLHAPAQELVLALHLAIDAGREVANDAHLAPRVGVAEGCTANGAAARAARQHLEEVHLVREHVDTEIGQHAVEGPAPAVRWRQVGRHLADALLVETLATARRR